MFIFTKDGLVHLVVNHPIPVSPDFDSTSSSFSPDTFNVPQLLLETQSEDEILDSEENKDDDKKKEDIDKIFLTPVSCMYCYYMYRCCPVLMLSNCCHGNTRTEHH